MGDYEVPVYYRYIPSLGYMVMLVDLYALSRNGTGTFIQHKAVIYCKVLQLWWPSCQKPCHEGFHFLTQRQNKTLAWTYSSWCLQLHTNRKDTVKVFVVQSLGKRNRYTSQAVCFWQNILPHTIFMILPYHSYRSMSSLGQLLSVLSLKTSP